MNADDLGYAKSVNRGILEAHRDGIVTSASLMVDAPGAADGVRLIREAPGLSVGLHAVLDDLPPERAEAELDRQLARFQELVGARPTHVDTHHHTHREPGLAPVYAAFAERAGLRARELTVRHEPRFYGEPSIRVERLLEVLETLPEGDSELGCHPGYAGGLSSRYTVEREQEIRTLTDPQVRERLDELGIALIGWADV